MTSKEALSLESDMARSGVPPSLNVAVTPSALAEADGTTTVPTTTYPGRPVSRTLRIVVLSAKPATLASRDVAGLKPLSPE